MFCKEDYAVDKLLVVSDLRDPVVSSLIKSFKYKFISDLADPLSRLILKHIDGLVEKEGYSIVKDNPLLVPVPLHRRREFWRGFNQSELIANLIAKRFRLDVSNNLIRVKQTVPQAEVEDREKRMINSKGLYFCLDSESFKGRHVILVDDVCTTGATFNECAKVLKEAGALSVTALAIARG